MRRELCSAILFMNLQKRLGRRMVRQTRLGSAVSGLGAGLIATAAMSAVMVVAQKSGTMGRMPPRHITEHALGRVGLDETLGSEAKKGLSSILHFAFGGASGALFGLLDHAFRRGPRLNLRIAGFETRPAPLGSGLLFGTAIWTVSYMGWVPALGILPQPPRDRPGRPIAMFLAHLVYGAGVAALVRRADKFRIR